MKQAIKCYIGVCGLILCLFLFGARQTQAQTRALQWDATVGQATVTIDEWCSAMEGYIEYTPKDKMMVGVTDKANPSTYQDMNYAMYPLVSSSQTWLLYYEDGNYLGNTIIDQIPQSSDLFRIDRKGSLIKFYFNNTLVNTFELPANPSYRVFSYNFGFNTVADLGAVASLSLVDPCSTYNPGSNNPTPDAKVGEAHNWVHSKIFDQQGEIVGETRVYLDRLGSAVQTQTKNYATNTVIGKQLVYDAEGRNALISLPAPTDDNFIEYQTKFLRSENTGQAFDYTDFDTPSKINDPSTVKNISGSIGRHYSNVGERLVPTSVYPYSQAEYHLDGSVRRVSKAGEHYRMGSGNETKYFYATSGGELAYLYGYRKSYEVDIPANDPLHPIPQDIIEDILAYKTITIDSDGIEHISYSDTNGKLLATAVSGQAGASNCSLQKARHELEFRGTQNTKIHLPAATKQSLIIDYSTSYLVNTDPLNNIIVYLTDLSTDV
ncbi:MAG: hypothetical protein AAFP19_14690, partial [Bacteroidota bacterium]